MNTHNILNIGLYGLNNSKENINMVSNNISNLNNESYNKRYEINTNKPNYSGVNPPILNRSYDNYLYNQTLDSTNSFGYYEKEKDLNNSLILNMEQYINIEDKTSLNSLMLDFKENLNNYSSDLNNNVKENKTLDSFDNIKKRFNELEITLDNFQLDLKTLKKENKKNIDNLSSSLNDLSSELNHFKPHTEGFFSIIDKMSEIEKKLSKKGNFNSNLNNVILSDNEDYVKYHFSINDNSGESKSLNNFSIFINKLKEEFNQKSTTFINDIDKVYSNLNNEIFSILKEKSKKINLLDLNNKDVITKDFNEIIDMNVFSLNVSLNDLKEKEESSIDYFSSTENVLKLKESLLNNKTKVDLDEEMTKLLIYQKSFQANSKIIEVFDEMMNTILNLKK